MEEHNKQNSELKLTKFGKTLMDIRFLFQTFGMTYSISDLCMIGMFAETHSDFAKLIEELVKSEVEIKEHKEKLETIWKEAIDRVIKKYE